MNQTIYIAGKYTGLKHADAVAKFAYTKEQLIAAGIHEHHIVVPTELVPEGTAYELAMEICLTNMQRCGAVFMQLDWRESDGARREYNRAIELEKAVFYEEHEGLIAAAAWYEAQLSMQQLFTAAIAL
jgi:hypothetical protein